jgi:RNA polymerase sigma-70 factor (ECF subfamily)
MIIAPASDEQWRRLRADVGRLVGRRVPSADVDDVVQEVLLRVWRHQDELREDERFAGWLSQVVAHAAADHLRARQRHPLARYEMPEASAQTAESPADAVVEARALIAAVLRPFVEQLPPTYREAISLSELNGLPQAEIAQRLGITISGVKSRVQRGRRQLKDMLHRCCAIALDARGAPVTCDPKPGGVLPQGCCGDQPCSATGPSRPS